MSDITLNPCQFTATAGGTGDFVVSSATAGKNTPADLGAVDGKTYRYIASSNDGTQFESGSGVYTASTHTIARTTIDGSSNTDNSKVNFTVAPTVDVIGEWTSLLQAETSNAPASDKQLMRNAIGADFDSGTRQIFQQSSAPVGWTKSTAFVDTAMRIVSGSVGSGGSLGFSSIWGGTLTVGSHTLTAAEIPNLTVNVTSVTLEHNGSGVDEAQFGPGDGVANNFTLTGSTTNTGGGSHTHGLTWPVLYVDMILAQKN